MKNRSRDRDVAGIGAATTPDHDKGIVWNVKPSAKIFLPFSPSYARFESFIKLTL